MSEQKEQVMLDLDAYEDSYIGIKVAGKVRKLGKLSTVTYMKFKDYDEKRQKIRKENKKKGVHSDSNEVITNLRDQCYIVLKEFNSDLAKDEIDSISIPGLLKLSVFISDEVKKSFLDTGLAEGSKEKIKELLDISE